jgi:hypothetical protein
VEPAKKADLRVMLLYASSEPKFQQVVEETARKASENKYTYEVRDTLTLTPSDQDRFIDDIRAKIPSQVHGQIRSGGSRILPISHTGKLNRTIPILVFYDGPKAIDVYPKFLKGVMYDLDDAFDNPGSANVLSVEECIIALLSSKPQLLGADLEQVESEFETGSGVADLVFKDSSGLYMNVEVKETANQETVGQTLKQSSGLKDKLGLPKMRSAIVALGTSGNVQRACREAGVELYLVSTMKQV